MSQQQIGDKILQNLHQWLVLQPPIIVTNLVIRLDVMDFLKILVIQWMLKILRGPIIVLRVIRTMKMSLEIWNKLNHIIAMSSLMKVVVSIAQIVKLTHKAVMKMKKYIGSGSQFLEWWNLKHLLYSYRYVFWSTLLFLLQIDGQ